MFAFALLVHSSFHKHALNDWCVEKSGGRGVHKGLWCSFGGGGMKI